MKTVQMEKSLYDELKSYLKTVIDLFSDVDHASSYAKYARGGARSLLRRIEKGEKK